MKTYFHQTRLILIVCALVLAVAVLLLTIVFPLLRKMTETQTGISESQVRLRQIAAEIQNYKTLASDLSKVSTEQSDLLAMFPTREDMGSLVEGMESAVSAAGLSSKLTIVDNKEKQEQNPTAREKPVPPVVAGLSRLEEVPYALQVTGNYRGITDLFQYLEHLLFITMTDKVSITADQVQASDTGILRNTGTATAKLEGTLYILNP